MIPSLRAIARTNVLGVGISAINIPLAVAEIDRLIATRDRSYICVSGAHGIIECQRNERLREIHNRAALVTPDGMPLVWLSWWHGAKHVSRVYGPDLMLAVCEHSLIKGYRHFFFGGAKGVPERLAGCMRARFPEIIISGTCSPLILDAIADEDLAKVKSINATHPDIVWVGLGTPKQELWMAAHREHLHAPVLISVGAAFDFHAGVKSQAPKWMQRSGLEWLFRVLSEPARLGRRYAYIVPTFLVLVLLQELGLRRRQL